MSITIAESLRRLDQATIDPRLKYPHFQFVEHNPSMSIIAINAAARGDYASILNNHPEFMQKEENGKHSWSRKRITEDGQTSRTVIAESYSPQLEDLNILIIGGRDQVLEDAKKIFNLLPIRALPTWRDPRILSANHIRDMEDYGE